jgi:flagellar biosynthesis protein FlhG
MEMNPDLPSTIVRPSLELARVQFIQREFAPYLSGFEFSQSAIRVERFHWIHDRIFIDQWSPDRVRRALSATDRRGRIIAVTSGKGGVGKTTVSLNMSVAFAQCGRRTLLFDGDFGLGNVHVFAGVNPSVTILDVLEERVALCDAITTGPAGLKILCGASGVAKLASIERWQIEQLGAQMCRLAIDFDVIVIDTGAGIGRDVLRLLALADEVVVVATPNLASTLDAYGVIKAAHEEHVGATFGVLANLVQDQGQAAIVRDRLVSCAAQFLRVSVRDLGWLPRASRVEAANQSRQPIVESSPNCDITRRFRAIASGFLPDCGKEAVSDSGTADSVAA